MVKRIRRLKYLHLEIYFLINYNNKMSDSEYTSEESYEAEDEGKSEKEDTPALNLDKIMSIMRGIKANKAETISDIIDESLSNEVAALNKKRRHKDLELYDECMEYFAAEDVTLERILKSSRSNDLDTPEICRAIELYSIYSAIPELCNTKINLRNQINEILNDSSRTDNNNNKIVPTTAAGIRRAIKRMDAAEVIKDRVNQIYKRMLTYNSNDTSYASYKEKVNWCLQLPWNKEAPLLPKGTGIDIHKDWLMKVRRRLDEELYGMNDIKDELIRICNTRLRVKSSVASIALCGPPGVGKTSIATAFAKAIGLPFEKIALGGMDDASIFKGVQESWVGAAPSIILKSMSRAGVNNPVILFDEIDKISSEGHRGQEVQAALLHITDYSQNHSFRDNFLSEFEHDLSKIWFLFAMNDESKIDPVLKNRLDIIYVREYTRPEKCEMIKTKLWPNAIKSCVGLTKNNKITNIKPEDWGVTAAEILALSSAAGDTTSIRSIEKVLKSYFSFLALELTMGRASIPYVVKSGEIERVIKDEIGRGSDKSGASVWMKNSMYL